ncbi:hypothetical protein GOP47_0015806 [Adiantum capillus-veneris]|uniref:Uncharacterized protein n=1 Tax=Adiantum capillus-veneris TaxID=13818 RepID=A0A9D4ZDJ8_ADICA|nr:hypothetical protein GOP47_0015806 [Adiantum capillus-veneris]
MFCTIHVEAKVWISADSTLKIIHIRCQEPKCEEELKEGQCPTKPASWVVSKAWRVCDTTSNNQGVIMGRATHVFQLKTIQLDDKEPHIGDNIEAKVANDKASDDGIPIVDEAKAIDEDIPTFQ